MSLEELGMTQEEWEKEVSKSRARATMEVFCNYHGFPLESIEETENSFVFKVEFKF